MPGKVLVVDDDAVNRELLEEVLVAEGLEVVTAPDGRSTLQEFSRLKPDLVLLDVNMPFLDGFEVCRASKAIPTPGSLRSSWLQHFLPQRIVLKELSPERTDS
jgi:CheY-like chemotaxis protein